MSKEKSEQQKTSKYTNDKKQLMISLLMLVVSLTLLLTVVYAWYVGNANAGASGFDLSTDNSSVALTDTFTITRGLANGSIYNVYTYKRDTDGKYYEYNTTTQSFVLDDQNEKKPVSIGGLLPGEYLEFSITYARVGRASNMTYDIAMMGISGDTFTNVAGTVTYTILGVYRINMLDASDNLLDKNGAIIYPDGNNSGTAYSGYNIITSNTWLDYYDDEIQPAAQQTLQSGASWSSSDSTKTVKFRMSLDMTQLSTLELTNVLSEKQFSISGVRMIVTTVG